MGPLIVIHYTISAESDGEKNLKIAQHLPKLWAIKHWSFFYETPCRALYGLTNHFLAWPGLYHLRIFLTWHVLGLLNFKPGLPGW